MMVSLLSTTTRNVVQRRLLFKTNTTTSITASTATNDSSHSTTRTVSSGYHNDRMENSGPSVVRMIHTTTNDCRLQQLNYNKNNKADLNQVWKNRTKRFLESGGATTATKQNSSPTGTNSYSAATAIESIALLRHWSKQHSAEGTEMAWNVLQRIVQDESTLTATSSLLTVDDINGFFHGWAISMIASNGNGVHDGSSSSLDPNTLFHHVKDFVSTIPKSFPVNCQTYNTILDVAIRQGRDDAHLLADAIVFDHLQKSADAILFNTAISAHAKFGSPATAHAVFDTMKEQLTNNNSKNDRCSMDTTSDEAYGSLLSAYANHGQPHEAEQLFLTIPLPNIHHFNAVLHAWAKSKNTHHDSADRCYQLLRQYMNTTTGTAAMKITAVCFGTVIDAFSNQGRAHEAHKVLCELLELHHETQDPDLVPTIVEFNSVIAAWARSGQPDAVERAQRLVKSVETMFQEGYTTLRPGVETYTALIHAYAQSKRPEAGRMALATLANMWQMVQGGSVWMTPDVTCYNTVLDCLAKSSSMDAADDAERLLRSMQSHSINGNYGASLAPNAVSYSSVINAWSKSGAKNAPQRAQDLLDELNTLSLSTIDMTNVRVAYNAVVMAWARSGDPNASKRAEAIVEKMKQLEQQGGKNCGPDIFTYNALLQSYAMNQQAEKAESVLLWLCKDYLEHNGNVKVNIIAFNTVISAWSRRREHDAAIRAEEIFSKLRHVQGPLGIRPDTVTYTSMISAWSSSNDARAPQRVMNLLMDMQHRFQCGDQSCKPNSITFNWVLTALSKNQNANTLQNAYNVIATMHAMTADGHDNCKPTLNTFNSFLKCVARSRVDDKAKRAWQVLMDMKNHSVTPDLRTLNEVLAACAYSAKCNTNTRMEALEIAFKVFRRICQEHQPNPETFSFFFQSAAGLSATEEVDKAYSLCCQLGYQTNKYVCRDVQAAAPHLFLKSGCIESNPL